MRTETIYFIKPEELNRQLSYQLICSSIGSSKWGTGKVQRAYVAEFNEEEQRECDKIYHKCRKWYLRSFPTEEVQLTQKEMLIWQKLITFCKKHMTVYGGK